MATPATTPAPTEPTTTPFSGLEMTVTRSVLLAELALAQSIVSHTLGSPVLTHVHLVGADSQLTIKVFDLERGLSVTIPAVVKTPGVLAMPARKLFDYLRLLPEGEIAIKALDNFWADIRRGHSHAKMVGLNPQNFPTLPTGGEKMVRLPAETLKMLVARTEFAVSHEESRYQLNGALLGLDSKQLAMVATDGHRLSYMGRTEQIEGVEAAAKALVPLAALRDLDNLLRESNATEVEFTEDDANLYFTIGPRRYSTRKLVGKFPDYTKIIPTDNDKVVIVPVAELEKALLRAAQFSDARSRMIRLTLADNTLTVSAESVDDGKTEEAIDVAYTGEPITAGLNANYLVDYLKSIGGKGEVRFEIKDAKSALVLKREGEDDATAFCLLMPCVV